MAASWKAKTAERRFSMSDAISILLIDGNHHDREYYAHRLKVSSPDYDVIQVETGRAGLYLCARQPIDCVILEIDLLDMPGFEVLAKLVPCASRPEIAVIVLTGHPNPCLFELAVKNGAQAAFRKSIVCGDMLDTAILKAISKVKTKKAHQRFSLLP